MQMHYWIVFKFNTQKKEIIIIMQLQIPNMLICVGLVHDIPSSLFFHQDNHCPNYKRPVNICTSNIWLHLLHNLQLWVCFTTSTSYYVQ